MLDDEWPGSFPAHIHFVGRGGMDRQYVATAERVRKILPYVLGTGELHAVRIQALTTGVYARVVQWRVNNE